MYSRTSASLPKGIYVRLCQAEKVVNFSKQCLALKCLKRLKKNLPKLKIRNRNTVCYNRETCKKKLYVLWPENIHNYLQALRYAEKVSVSYMLCQAVELYLDKILAIFLSKRFSKRYNRALEATFKSIHRAVSFQHENVIGIRLMMIRAPDKPKSINLVV